MGFSKKIKEKILDWLTNEPIPKEVPPCDFTRLKHEIRPGDVILVEGHSHISKVVSKVTNSPWSHAALYIGRINDIEDDDLRQLVEEYLQNTSNKNTTEITKNTRLIIEGLLGKGTIVTPLNTYRHHHVRICRPIEISHADAQLVIAYAIKGLGKPYNVRQSIDLARFLLPWTIFPRRWGSTLFTTPSGEPESGICSSLLAEAFTSVKFPILPYSRPNKNSGIELFHRNPYLITPKDFDYSPYFEIIKYPILSPEELPYYRRLPWTEEQAMHQGHGEFVHPKPTKKKKEKLAPPTPASAENLAVESQANDITNKTPPSNEETS